LALANPQAGFLHRSPEYVVITRKRASYCMAHLPIDGGISRSVVAGLGEAGPGSPTPGTSS
jgi:hypothetical protein